MSDDAPAKTRFHTVEVAQKARDIEPAPGFIIPEGTATDERPNWGDTDIVTPKMPPETLVEVYRKSAEVPKNARARGQNVAGYGWTLDPVIKFDDPELEEKASLWIFLDRVAQYRRDVVEAVARKEDPDSIEKPQKPTEAEVQAEIAAWKERAIMEHALLSIRMENLCVEWPLQELIKRTEINRSGMAYVGWEILRDAMNVPIRAKLKEPLNLRATPEDKKAYRVKWLRKVSDVSYEEVILERRFRRYLIKRDGADIWFKEYGAPYVVSQKTGKIYEDEKAFLRAKADNRETKNAQLATELLLWAEYSPGAEPYGMPIWHGHSLDVETARVSKEYDYDELANGKLMRGLFTVIDGMMDSPVVDGLKKFLREGGIGNRTRIGILEIATSSMAEVAGAGRAIIDFMNLSAGQHDEATHLKAKEMADSGVSQDFGNPGIFLGRTKDVQNRATAQTAQQVAEEQTYSALRDLWAHVINEQFVLPWGFRFWRWRLNSPRQQRMAESAGLLKVALDNNVFRPDQVIQAFADLLGITITDEPMEWQKVPAKAANQGLTAEFLPQEPEVEGEEDEDEDRAPGETEAMGEGDADAARELLQAIGLLAADITEDAAEKMRDRLKLSRDIQISEGKALGPDLLPED